MNIYILFEEQEQGPFTKSEIFALMKGGSFGPDAFGRYEDESEWRPINTVLASGSLGLFTPAQIDRQQAELEAAPVIVPDLFTVSREVSAPNSPSLKRRWVSAACLVSTLVVTSTWVLLRFVNQSDKNATEITLSSIPTSFGGAKLVELKSKPAARHSPTPPPPRSLAISSAGDTLSSKSESYNSLSAPESRVTPTSIPRETAATPDSRQPYHEDIASIDPSVRATEDTNDAIKLQASSAPSSSPPNAVAIRSSSNFRPPELTPAVSPLPSGMGTNFTLGNGYSASRKDDFFTIRKIKLFEKDPSKTRDRYPKVFEIVRDHKKNIKLPCQYLEVEVRTKKTTLGSKIYAKAYFYDANGKLIRADNQPFPIPIGLNRSSMPAIFKAQEWSKIVFAVPLAFEQTKAWKAVIVFGDTASADAEVYPSGNFTAYQFPERHVVENPVIADRKEAMDPLVEYVVKTKNYRAPQITLLLRPPIGMTNARHAKGVLALCVLAGSVEEMKRLLQRADAKDDLGWILRFAEKEKLVILCWGAKKGFWRADQSWDEVDKFWLEKNDKDFTEISNAWYRGVTELARKYGIPDRGFLLVGGSAGAQYAMRLALRQPQAFHAVYLHIPSSFDRPTPKANKILWCLTTGELESGYERSIRFYEQCRALGYPLIYKAIVGLGHKQSSYADSIGEAFLSWALQERDAREKFDLELTSALSPVKRAWEAGPPHPWLDSFRNPPFVGDLLNQEMFPWKDREMVPVRLQVSLPTKQIADAWNAQMP